MFACSKGYDKPSTENKPRGEIEISNATKNKIDEINNLSKSKVSVAYNTLNSYEKAAFWQDHINRYLNSHSNISKELRGHISKLQSFVTPELYETLERPATKERIVQFTKEWFEEPLAANRFSADELFEVSSFYKIGKSEVTKQSLEKSSSLQSSENCTCYYSVYCDIGGGGGSCIDNAYCRDNGPFNCGVSGTSRCTGNCQ